MSVTKRSGQSEYAGFLDGYIAGNLSANSRELSFHTVQIISFIKDLRGDLKNWHLNDKAKIVDDEFIKIESLNVKNDFEFYFNLGDILLNVFATLNEFKENLPTTAKYNINKVIYHYLNIAQTLKDAKITKKAKSIVDKFEGSDIKS